MDYLDTLTDEALDILAAELAREVAYMYPSKEEAEAMCDGKPQGGDDATPGTTSPQ
jgi:hypothetical protein